MFGYVDVTGAVYSIPLDLNPRAVTTSRYVDYIAQRSHRIRDG